MCKNKYFPTLGMNGIEIRDFYVNKSIEKFNNKFDYSDIKSIQTQRDEIVLTCNMHGTFITTFEKHIKSPLGCAECGKQQGRDNKRMTFDEFLKRLDDIHPNKFFKILSKEFKGRRIKDEKIYTQDEFGICKMNVHGLLNGAIPNIKSALFPNLYAKNKYNKKHNYINLCFDNSIYNGAQSYTIVKCRKHGEFATKPNWILNGQGCANCFEDKRGEYLRSNTKDFINKAVKRLNTNRSIYDKVNYVNAKEKVLIKCEIHNNYYSITPNDHLTGYGCPTCGIENGGYSRSDYVRQAKDRDGTLYIIKLLSEEEQFYKIGITFKGVKTRFSGASSLPYKYEIINEYICDAGCTWDLEKELHKKYKHLQYFPIIRFQGYTECFTLDLPVEEITSYLKQF